MRVLTKITITLLTAITILNAEAQSKITTQDYEVTNDVIKIEEHNFKETTTKNISEHNLQTKLTIKFSKGLIKSSKSEYIKSNQIVNYTYFHSKPHKEYTQTNTSSQDKKTLKLLTFNNLNWYFPTTNFSISKKIPNQLLELSYKSKTHFPYHKLEVKKNGLTEDYMTTGYGPVIYTYNTEGQKIKEFFPGLFGYNLVYDSDGFLKEKTRFNSVFSKEKTYYFYKKDKRGNWIQKLAIKSDTNSSEKLTFTSRKLTYSKSEVTGSVNYDETFIKWGLLQYSLDFKDKSIAKTGNTIPNGIVWKKSEDNKQYWLYVNKKLIKNEGITFWINNHLYVYLTKLKEIYFLENFKTLTANTFYEGKLLKFKPLYGIWYKMKSDAVIVRNAKGKRIKEASIYKYATNKIDVIFKGLNESQILLFKNFKNATINNVYPAEIYNSPKKTTINNLNNVTKKIGCIEGDCKNGKGTYLWANKDSYEGDYINGNRTGQGIYIWGGNGNKYIGGFINGKQNGKGTYYDYKKGIKYIQIYNNGKATETISKTNIAINNSTSTSNISDFQTKINSCKQQANPYNCIFKKIAESYNSLKKSGTTNSTIVQTTVNNLNKIGRYNVKILYEILINPKNPITKEDRNKIMPKLEDNIKNKLKIMAQKIIDDYSKTHNMN